MNDHLPKVFQDALAPFAPAEPVGQQFTEADLIAADLHYLESQKQRDARRLAETCDLERAVQARSEWRRA